VGTLAYAHSGNLMEKGCEEGPKEWKNKNDEALAGKGRISRLNLVRTKVGKSSYQLLECRGRRGKRGKKKKKKKKNEESVAGAKKARRQKDGGQWSSLICKNWGHLSQKIERVPLESERTKKKRDASNALI